MKHRMSEGMTNIGTPLKEAMERTPRPKEPEQEPVACYEGGEDIIRYKDIPLGAMLYTTPPQRTWVGLTPDEMLQCNLDEEGIMVSREQAKRNVEAKLKEKNT